jgi:hypothetical protein
LKIPVGPDADLLCQVGITEFSSNPVMEAFARILRRLLPPPPWQLTVTAQSKDSLTVNLSRIGQPVDTRLLDRRDLVHSLREVVILG